MRFFSAVLSMAILGCWTGAAQAADAERPLDDNFLIKASSCNNAMVEVSKLADKRSASDKVKEFAGKLIADHQKCHEKIATVIKNRKLAIVSGFEKDVQEQRDRLSKLQGAEFDKEYLRWVIQQHKDGVAIMENQTKNGKDAEVRSFAEENLPAIRDHLKHAEELAKTIN